MRSFLSQVLDDALPKDLDLKGYCFVLPNKRSSLFLKRELQSRLKPNSFFPEILSIEEFMGITSGYRILDNVGLLFEFYSVFKKNSPETGKNSFESFSKWAQVMLQDFNELDSSLAEAEAILRYIYEAKRIENWSVSGNEPSEMVSSYISFHALIPKFYISFQERMEELKAGYQGFVYRKAFEAIAESTSCVCGDKLVFAGFNALSKCEELVIEKLLEKGLASIYWDDDEFYEMADASAGSFIKKYRERWSHYRNHPFKWTYGNINSKKTIHLHGLPKNISQIKHAGDILKSLGTEGDLDNTALVMGNEKLLPVLLNSLPEEISEANITMGYELQNVSLSNFFESLFRAHTHKSGRRDSKAFYYKDLQCLFRDPHMRIHCQSDPFFERKWHQVLYEDKRLFLSESEIMDLVEGSPKLNELFTLLFLNWDDKINVLLKRLCLISEWFRDAKEQDRMDDEMLYRFNTVFRQLLNFNEKYQHINSLDALHDIYRQLLKMEKMSFQGEPLSGLQIMGLLESRVLDFNTVILTSVNEGFLPAGGSDRSFIPLDIKFEKNLPTFREKEAIFSYHFFRLLHRAEEIYLVYNNVNDEFGAGEPSRFIKQLEIASKLGILDQVTFKKVSLEPNPTSHPIELKTIAKTPEVLSKIHEIAKRGFSPTAFTTYIRNPLDYYKRYVLGIEESLRVEESMAANTFGTVVHNTLESLYSPHLNTWLQTEMLDEMLKAVNDTVRIEWSKVYSSKASISGKIYLSFEIAKKFVADFIRIERNALESGNRIKILGLEKKVLCTHRPAGTDVEVLLKGTIDRIEEFNGVIRIVDYKTGKVSASDLKITDWDLLVTDEKYNKAFQVLMYAYIYLKNEEEEIPLTGNLESGIISFKNLKSGFIKVDGQAISELHLDSFVEKLDLLLKELYALDVPFREKEVRSFSY